MKILDYIFAFLLVTNAIGAFVSKACRLQDVERKLNPQANDPRTGDLAFLSTRIFKARQRIVLRQTPIGNQHDQYD